MTWSEGEENGWFFPFSFAFIGIEHFKQAAPVDVYFSSTQAVPLFDAIGWLLRAGLQVTLGPAATQLF